MTVPFLRTRGTDKTYVSELKVLSIMSSLLPNLIAELNDSDDSRTADMYALAHHIIFNRAQDLVLKYSKKFDRAQLNDIIQNKQTIDAIQRNYNDDHTTRHEASKKYLYKFKMELIALHLEEKNAIRGTLTAKICIALHDITEREITLH
ncbi:hypothetical protein [Emiliania huxleyi virus 99B1]|nr:hypothetical protein [Emiliania huxleyi virus 99B1]|mmetsp:Transcript_8094/g.24035  ORF Transcript_8094/g.24035 Transcript_8094/m.24035 type:complete len:149 (-) Transcript_8094:1045-1491(-)